MTDIDFLDEAIRQESNATRIGICDSNEHHTDPAYVTDTNGETWIATILNGAQTSIAFYPIDNAVDFMIVRGDDPSKCDGILEQNNNDLILVELKERGGEGWFKKGKNQIISTINLMENHNTGQRSRLRHAYVCNNLRPKSISNRSSSIQEFAEKYRVVLHDRATIVIS